MCAALGWEVEGGFAVLFLACTQSANIYTNSMRILMLYTPGRETPVTLPKLREMGYEVELVDSRVSQACLTNSKAHLSKSTKYQWSSIVDPLRAAWVSMLRRFANADKYTLFCESDAYPHISAAKLKEWIDSVPEDAAVVRLIRYANRKIYKENIEQGVNSEETKPSFVKMPKHIDNCEIWGTHALWVAPGRREELAAVFADYSLPVDVALGYVSYANLPLKVYSTDCPLFSQQLYGKGNTRVPTKLLVCLWIDDSVTELDTRLKLVFEMLPATSYLAITTPTNNLKRKIKSICQQISVGKNWTVQKADVTWDSNASLGVLKPDDISNEEYPMTCVLSQHVEYPLIYLREIAFCYKTLPYDHACFGMSIPSEQRKSLCGTLVVKTSKLPEIKYVRAIDLEKDLVHYDLSSWKDTFILKSSSPALLQFKDIGTGTGLAIEDKPYRRYDDILISDEDASRGAIQREEEDGAIEVEWENTGEVKIYKLED